MSSKKFNFLALLILVAILLSSLFIYIFQPPKNAEEFVRSRYKDEEYQIVDIKENKKSNFDINYQIVLKNENKDFRIEKVDLKRDGLFDWKIENKDFQIYRNNQIFSEEVKDGIFQKYWEFAGNYEVEFDNVEKCSKNIESSREAEVIFDLNCENKIEVVYDEQYLHNYLILNGNKLEELGDVYSVVFEQIGNPEYFYYSTFEVLPEEERGAFDSVYNQDIYRYDLNSENSELFIEADNESYGVETFASDEYVVSSGVSSGLKLYDSTGDFLKDYNDQLESEEFPFKMIPIEITKDRIFLTSNYSVDDLYVIDLKTLELKKF